MASSIRSGLVGVNEAFPSLTIKFPFLSKNTPSILSRYLVSSNEIVNSRLSSLAGVLEKVPPGPVKLRNK
jgi:hypothetical protein